VSDKLSVLSPLDPPGNLAEQVIARLANDIRSGRLEPGARLPTEQALSSALGVSRTVVREAVAALRADGLVVTRRGSGAYVADPTAGPFRIAAPKAAALADVLQVMELRLAVEVEAAALAAERASRRQVGVIRTAWRGIDRARYLLPEKPGLGIELNEEAIAKHPYQKHAFPSLWDDRWLKQFTRNKG